MTVIVFLIDTSASMMQKSYLGTTYLDFARLTVEQFLKVNLFKNLGFGKVSDFFLAQTT